MTLEVIRLNLASMSLPILKALDWSFLALKYDNHNVHPQHEPAIAPFITAGDLALLETNILGVQKYPLWACEMTSPPIDRWRFLDMDHSPRETTFSWPDMHNIAQFRRCGELKTLRLG